ncbi:uncharacterized protein THITE_113942 [Thermothielavioides terrestris NRRL 8126]|uniref:Uncharacterized protein n=1 Tax=Thermothielavioides terrestris (strain ATCC 38088 / NRRL 8126) TaxID=578455 RepID=G2RBU6_THETT|nr:uncharacterized protein THITE_113942 [Thermothielavioides terrestris NRRL 8126]AEO69267.1 hypothetical protein THITE_113942 [Thermothielavioides terrestris NRRL 8126]
MNIRPDAQDANYLSLVHTAPLFDVNVAALGKRRMETLIHIAHLFTCHFSLRMIKFSGGLDGKLHGGLRYPLTLAGRVLAKVIVPRVPQPKADAVTASGRNASCRSLLLSQGRLSQVGSQATIGSFPLDKKQVVAYGGLDAEECTYLGMRPDGSLEVHPGGVLKALPQNGISVGDGCKALSALRGVVHLLADHSCGNTSLFEPSSCSTATSLRCRSRTSVSEKQPR